MGEWPNLHLHAFNLLKAEAFHESFRQRLVEG